MIRILYLATGVFDKGGISRYSRYQIQALRELLGQDAIQASSLWGHSPRDFEEPIDVAYAGQGPSSISKVLYLFRALLTTLQWKPTLIWANHIHLLPLALRLAFFSPGAKTVVNIYGLELWSGRESQHRHFLPQATHVISDCHFSARYARETYGVNPQNVSVIWDCVDVERFRPGPQREELLIRHGVPVGPDKRYIMTLGRLSDGALHKGYDRLLDAMQVWKDNPRIICLIAGDGDQRPRLEQRVRDEGLAGRVYFLGDIPESELVDTYNLCHVFTLVSDRGPGRGEGLPLTPLEAAACGKPIIVGNEDGSQEAVIDGYNGFVISPRDPEMYRKCVERLLLDDYLREQMGSAARKRIEEEFRYTSFRAKTGQVTTDVLRIQESRGEKASYCS